LKRRQLARAEGRVAASQQLTGVFVWFTMAVALMGLAFAGHDGLQGVFAELWNSPWGVGQPNAEALSDRLSAAMVVGARTVVPYALFCMLAAIVGRLAQVGFLWAPSRIAPNVSRLNPAPRLADLCSSDALLRLVRELGLTAAALFALGWAFWTQRNELAGLTSAAPADFPSQLREVVGSWSLRFAGCLALFAGWDYAYQRSRYEASLRMSPEELRAEIQAIQSNPQVAAGRRDLQRAIRQPVERDVRGDDE
jgi:flagellar biosynthetic protein FlhB